MHVIDFNNSLLLHNKHNNSVKDELTIHTLHRVTNIHSTAMTLYNNPIHLPVCMIMSFILIPSDSKHSVFFVRVCRIVDEGVSVALKMCLNSKL